MSLDVIFKDGMFALNYDVTVKQYPYRTATVYDDDTIFFIDRMSAEGRKFEELLAKKAGVHTDNHTAYELTTGSGKKLFVGCSDFKIRVGLSMEVSNW